MDQQESQSSRRLALVDGILAGAFFSPLHLHDWLAFRFGQPALLGLEDEEALDLFLRATLTLPTLQPEAVEGRSPLAWLWAMEDPQAVLAHVLASLRVDRPLLFHRVLFSLPAVSRGEIAPQDFELAEDFLQTALGPGLDLTAGAAGDLETLEARACKAAGQDPERPDPRVSALAQGVLSRPQAAEMTSDVELRLWLTSGDGLEGVDPALAPAVLAACWAAWAGAVTGARPDLDLLSRAMPALGISADELAGHAPPLPQAGHVISALCPWCQQENRVRLGAEIKPLHTCSHLLYLGTSDEAHLLEVVGRFDLGEDFRALLASYYQSADDLDLFSTIVNDLYEMFREQGRLDVAPVTCVAAPRAFYNLRAYFSGPPPGEDTRH